MNPKNFLLLFILSVFVFTACSGSGTDTSDLPIAPEKGALAPDFELATPDGDIHRLSDYRGTPVLVNFWATWCGPCRAEMPAMDALYRAADGAFQILAVDYDESAKAVSAFGEELDLSFPLVIDEGGDLQVVYQVRGYPSSYFVDADGVIQVVHIGVMTEDQIVDYLAQIGVEN